MSSVEVRSLSCRVLAYGVVVVIGVRVRCMVLTRLTKLCAMLRLRKRLQIM